MSCVVCVAGMPGNKFADLILVRAHRDRDCEPGLSVDLNRNVNGWLGGEFGIGLRKGGIGE